MSETRTALATSAEEQRRIERFEGLSVGADTLALLEGLSDPSWVVRRVVVDLLARAGDAPARALVESMLVDRTDEARIAATVDALAASVSRTVDALLLSAADTATAASLVDILQILGRRRCTAATSTLAGLTTHPDENVAVAAIEALGRVGGAAAVTALVACTSSGSFFRTYPAIDVLGRCGDPSVVAPLARLLTQQIYALEAMRALGRTGELEAAHALLGALPSANEAGARVIAASLVEIRDQRRARLGSGRDVETALLETTGNPGRRLARALAGGDAAERAAMAQVLGWIGGADALFALGQLLDGETTTAHVAARALDELGEEATTVLRVALQGDGPRRAMLLPLVGHRSVFLPEVTDCLDDADPAVRAAACDAIARLGAHGAALRLFERLEDTDRRVTQAAVAAIQALGGPETERLALVHGRSPVPSVRYAAMRIVSYFGFVSALPLLLETIASADERGGEIAIGALAFVDAPSARSALFAACASEAPKARAAAMRALGNLPRSALDAREALVRGLSDADAWVRYFACQSLGRMRSAPETEAIIALAHDPAGHVRVAAIEALAQIGTERALVALDAAARSSDADVHRAALVGLGQSKRASAARTLFVALASDDVATRLVAVSALAQIGTPEAFEGVARATRDPNELVRNSAFECLGASTTPEALAGLYAHLDDAELHDRAVAALGRRVPGRAVALGAALRQADATHARAIVSALVALREDDALDVLEDALASGGVEARRASAAALSALGIARHRDTLDRAASLDSDAAVRRNASRARAT